MSPFLFNFNFLNNKKLYQKQKKIKKIKINKTINFQKKSSSGNNWYLHGWAAV